MSRKIRLMRMKSVIVLVVLMWLAPAWAAPDTRPGAASGGLTDVAGIKLGHYTLDQRPTGCTVILVEDGAVAGVDVRGSAPGTRETDLLRPTGLVDQVHAIVLAGGSAFGLAAASGVVQYLEERGIGFVTPTAKVPIVPAAILYDLGVGDASIRPTAECGYRAAQAATDGPVVEGNVGAGAGATVGKLAGAGRAMKSGLGTASISLADGLTVAALVAVNAVGDIIDPHTNRIVAGLRSEDGTALADSRRLLRLAGPTQARSAENTTLGVVATNARLTKVGATTLAQMAHDGFARAINPVHTPYDGDTIFALATGTHQPAGTPQTALLQIGALAAEVMAEAIVRAGRAAVGIPGYPAARDLAPSDSPPE
jgi:L-aminopeptidase/D-esterase-like protein